MASGAERLAAADRETVAAYLVGQEVARLEVLLDRLEELLDRLEANPAIPQAPLSVDLEQVSAPASD